MTTQSTTRITYDPILGEHILELPYEVIAELNWRADDILKWCIMPDGKIVLSRLE